MINKIYKEHEWHIIYFVLTFASMVTIILGLSFGANALAQIIRMCVFLSSNDFVQSYWECIKTKGNGYGNLFRIYLTSIA